MNARESFVPIDGKRSYQIVSQEFMGYHQKMSAGMGIDR